MCRKKQLQRKSDDSAIEKQNDSEVPSIVHEVLRSHGQPLDRAARAFMEPRFGHDFSNVRVHTDARSAESALVLNAKAYTMENHIVFAPGEYNRQSYRGRRLLAHELTHVLQPRISPTRTGAGASTSGEDVAECEADSVGRKIALGLPLPAWTPVKSSSLLNLAPETWFRGEVEGSTAAKDGGVVHDLGDGTYFSDRVDVAEGYATKRSVGNDGTRRVLTGQVDTKNLGRVLDLTEDAEFMTHFKFVKGKLSSVSGEPYRNLVDGHLAKRGYKLEDFDTIIGPEGVGGGKQMCIHNPKIATEVKASLLPLTSAGEINVAQRGSVTPSGGTPRPMTTTGEGEITVAQRGSVTPSGGKARPVTTAAGEINSPSRGSIAGGLLTHGLVMMSDYLILRTIGKFEAEMAEKRWKERLPEINAAVDQREADIEKLVRSSYGLKTVYANVHMELVYVMAVYHSKSTLGSMRWAFTDVGFTGLDLSFRDVNRKDDVALEGFGVMRDRFTYSAPIIKPQYNLRPEVLRALPTPEKIRLLKVLLGGTVSDEDLAAATLLGKTMTVDEKAIWQKNLPLGPND